MSVAFDEIRWRTDEESQGLPDGATGYIGTAPGLHVVVVTWDGRAAGTVTYMWEGRIVVMLPDDALRAAEIASAAVSAAKKEN